MQIELRFFANFREAVGQKTVHREYETDRRRGCVRQLSDDNGSTLRARYYELREYV